MQRESRSRMKMCDIHIEEQFLQSRKINGQRCGRWWWRRHAMRTSAVETATTMYEKWERGL